MYEINRVKSKPILFTHYSQMSTPDLISKLKPYSNILLLHLVTKLNRQRHHHHLFPVMGLVNFVSCTRPHELRSMIARTSWTREQYLSGPTQRANVNAHVFMHV